MKILERFLGDVLLLEPRVFGDSRGFFFESFNAREFGDVCSIDACFVQDNHSRSARGVLRGMHYQIEQPQGKLVRVASGEVFDVVVDLRRASPTFGHWAGVRLDAQNKHMLWVPPGFAHGFLVLSESADFLYKATDYYAPQHERTLAWNDPTVAIDWPLGELRPALSAKDQAGLALSDAQTYG